MKVLFKYVLLRTPAILSLWRVAGATRRMVFFFQPPELAHHEWVPASNTRIGVCAQVFRKKTALCYSRVLLRQPENRISGRATN